MNKSYKTIPINRQKHNHYSQQSTYKDKKHFYKRILKQIVICSLVVLFVMLVKNIHSPITNKTTEWIKTSLTREMDMKKSIKQVVKYAKEIPKIPDKAVNVFGTFSNKKKSNMEFVVPIEGEIISNYGENVDPYLNTKTFQRGVDLFVNKEKNIAVIADGEVVEVGEGKSLGKYVKVKHGKELFSLYANCSNILVKRGSKVKQGEEIAIIHSLKENEDTYLHFELWIEGKVVDPTQYIPFDRKII
ncbi:M23 family metallopeptidase [Marinisporobacter balticus]|uniref:Peptidase M23-like protein n=1 Tax=Marinisporobacter balticus TaxID=2018667 RepID=A0A4R2L7J1_9FIRM|nr:M23 family metallopeptidase [Marinisporobacter balticus]TCO79976.1 peptidase M23-like protein [Marinisporobacter balticus]